MQESQARAIRHRGRHLGHKAAQCARLPWNCPATAITPLPLMAVAFSRTHPGALMRVFRSTSCPAPMVADGGRKRANPGTGPYNIPGLIDGDCTALP